MRKLVVLMMVLAMASLASATTVLSFGDATSAFATADSSIQVAAGVTTMDIYVWGSSDIVLDSEDLGATTAQIAVKFNDITKANLSGGLTSKFTAISGNPFATTTVAGKAYSGADTIKGSVLNLDGIDAFGMTKIFKLTVDVQNGGKMTFLNSGSPLETFIGTGAAGKIFSNGSVMFTPEPATMAILGLGALMLRRKKA